MDEMETPSCRAASGTNASERARRETSTHVLFMTEAQLKKLDDAVLHRDIGIYNERLKTLKADLIREATATRKTSQSSKATDRLRCTLEYSLLSPRSIRASSCFSGSWQNGSPLFSLAFTPFNCSPTTRGAT